MGVKNQKKNMAKVLSTELNETTDPSAAREERKATGRMIALFVALLLILLVMYHAWIRNTPVLAGVMVPALIMLLYAAGVLFLAKRDKLRRIQVENSLRANNELIKEITSTNGSLSTANTHSVSSPAKNTTVSTVVPKTSKSTKTIAKISTITPPATAASTVQREKISSAAKTKKKNIPTIDENKLKSFEKSVTKYKVINEKPKREPLARSLSAT